MITDTLHVIAQMPQVYKSNPNLDVVYYVNNFYQQAWDKLIWAIGSILAIVGTIVGVVIPLVIQHYQKERAKDSEDRLRTEIGEAKLEMKIQIASAIKEAREEIDVAVKSLITSTREDISNSVEVASGGLRLEIAALISDTKNEIDNAIEDAKSEMLNNATDIIEQKIAAIDLKADIIYNKLMARGSQNQGNFNMSVNSYSSGFADYIMAAVYYVKSGDNRKAELALDHIISNVLSKIVDKQKLNEALEKKKVDLIRMLNIISDEGNLLNPKVEEIRKFHEELPSITDEKG